MLLPSSKVDFSARTQIAKLMAKTENAKLDSSLKRHTALIKRIRQSMASDNREQIMKDIDTLTLEKYIDELAGAIVEGLGRCKTEKDIWGAVEVCCWPRLQCVDVDNLPCRSYQLYIGASRRHSLQR